MCLNLEDDKLKPYALSLALMRLCGTQSKAFERSVSKLVNALALSSKFSLSQGKKAIFDTHTLP